MIMNEQPRRRADDKSITDINTTMSQLRLDLKEHQGEINTSVAIIATKVDNIIEKTDKEYGDCQISRKAMYEKIEKVDNKIGNAYKVIYGIGVAIIGSIGAFFKVKG